MPSPLSPTPLVSADGPLRFVLCAAPSLHLTLVLRLTTPAATRTSSLKTPRAGSTCSARCTIRQEMVSALRVLSPALRVAVCACTARITRAHTCATSSVRTASAPALVLTPYSRRPHLHTQRRCERARVQAPCEGHRMSPRSSETLIDSTRRRSERRRRLPGSPCGRVLRRCKAFRASAEECVAAVGRRALAKRARENAKTF